MSSRKTFVKKVSRVVGDGYEVASLVPWGSGSRDFGVVRREDVLGTLLTGGAKAV
jgi:hypothetical protein